MIDPETIPDSALKRLGGALTELLDDDQWNNVEKNYLLPALKDQEALRSSATALEAEKNRGIYDMVEAQMIAEDKLDRLRARVAELESMLAESCDEGRGDPEHPVCSRAATAEARIAELEQSRNSWHKLADEFEIQQDHYRLTLEHLRAAIRDHGTCSGTLMVNPGQGHGIVTADDFIANSLEIFN